MLTAEEVKNYLRVDGEEDNALISRLMTVAEAYLAGAVENYDKHVRDDGKFRARAEMVALVIIQELYENRNQGGRETKDFGFTVRSLISHLQYWGDDS